MPIRFQSPSRSLAAAVALITLVAPGTAYADANAGYVGITSGGAIKSEDRIASDDLRDIDASAQISSENEVLSANFSLDFSVSGQAKQSPDGRTYSVASHNFSVKASIPLNSTDEGALVDFKTFGNDGQLTIGFNSYKAKFISPYSTLPDLARFAGGCIAEASQDWKGDPAQVDQVQVAYEKSATEVGSIEARLGRARDATKDETDGGFGSAAFEYCRQGGTAGVGNANHYVRFASAAIGGQAARAWRGKYFNPQGTIFWGGEVSIGYNRYSILDRPTVSVGVKDRIGFDANARVGYVFGGEGMVLMASGGYTRSYKPKDVAEVCGPPDLSGNTTCVSGQDGLPDRAETGYATVSLRKVLLRNKQGQPILGVRPSVTYVFEDKAWQFELPVYLQRSDAGGLDAGVRVIFNTGSDKFGLGAFVGVPF